MRRIIATFAGLAFVCGLGACAGAPGDTSGEPSASPMQNATSPSENGADKVGSVTLKNGKVVDCIIHGGVTCDWNHPRNPMPNEETKAQPQYFTLNTGDTVPCVTLRNRVKYQTYDNGISCDWNHTTGRAD